MINLRQSRIPPPAKKILPKNEQYTHTHTPTTMPRGGRERDPQHWTTLPYPADWVQTSVNQCNDTLGSYQSGSMHLWNATHKNRNCLDQEDLSLWGWPHGETFKQR